MSYVLNGKLVPRAYRWKTFYITRVYLTKTDVSAFNSAIVNVLINFNKIPRWMGGFSFQVACLRLVASGLPMGSPLSPVVANIFMENFDNIAITRFRRPPKIWKWYVDDTFVILSKYSARSFLGHISEQLSAPIFRRQYRAHTCIHWHINR